MFPTLLLVRTPACWSPIICSIGWSFAYLVAGTRGWDVEGTSGRVEEIAKSVVSVWRRSVGGLEASLYWWPDIVSEEFNIWGCREWVKGIVRFWGVEESGWMHERIHAFQFIMISWERWGFEIIKLNMNRFINAPSSKIIHLICFWSEIISHEYLFFSFRVKFPKFFRWFKI